MVLSLNHLDSGFWENSGIQIEMKILNLQKEEIKLKDSDFWKERWSGLETYTSYSRIVPISNRRRFRFIDRNRFAQFLRSSSS